MHRFLPLFVILIVFVAVANFTHAQILFPEHAKSGSSTVTATVGRFSVNLSGYQSPYATIVLSTRSGLFLRSTTADAAGYFTITDVLLTDDINGLCFKAIDFKRLGESEACINIAIPITENLAYDNIFLPPTIGLSKKQINAGQDAVIFGYSMPRAKVTISIEGKTFTVNADETGYYQYTYENIQAGVYRLYATAQISDEKSLTPTGTITLEALSLTQQITQAPGKAAEKVSKIIPFDLAAILLFALFLLAVILFLLYKLRIRIIVIVVDKLKHRNKMHHDWFLGYPTL